jgi:hypothetical protein
VLVRLQYGNVGRVSSVGRADRNYLQRNCRTQNVQPANKAVRVLNRRACTKTVQVTETSPVPITNYNCNKLPARRAVQPPAAQALQPPAKLCELRIQADRN